MVLSARRFIVGASPELKSCTTEEADPAHVVSGLRTARKRWYIFSPDFVRIATFLECNASVRHCLFWINDECICCRRFHYSLSFVALINIAINFDYKYFCFVIYFSKIVYPKLFPKFVFNIFFLKFLFKIFFWGLYSWCLPVYRDKTNSMYLCYEKYDIQQAVEIGLSSRVMCKVFFFNSYCSHYTRREKFNFLPAPSNILLYFYLNLRYLIDVLKCFLDGI